MVRDIKKNEDYTFIKDVFPNEIEVNLFIFPHKDYYLILFSSNEA
jgi:hypothetical protein